MAMPGKKPKTVAQKRVEGNMGKRALTTMVPKPRGGALVCPTAVMKNERALVYWDLYTGTAAPGHLAPLDAPLLARMCLCFALADEAWDDMVASGKLVKAPNTGLPIQSPFLPIWNRQNEIALKICSALCLPPAERNRLGAVDDDDDDPTAHFFDA